MDDIRVRISKFLQTYKFIIGFVVVAIILFLLVVKEMGKSTRGDSSNTISESALINSIQSANVSTTKDIVKNNEINSYADVQEKITNTPNRIEAFILLCNQGKTDVAYEMLTDSCKEELYPTKEDFINKYYNTIFKPTKYYDISGFKNGTYKVTYYDNSLETGVEADKGIIDYITYDSSGKVSISGFIDSKEMDIKSIGNYFTIKITKRKRYVDCIKYTISMKNNTYADIYINDVDNSNLYIRTSDGNRFYINSSDYLDYNYLVQGKNEKEIELKFDAQYQSGNDAFSIVEMDFDAIKIVNKEYYDNTKEVVINEETGEVGYQKKYTNYPLTMTYKIKIY